MSIWSQIAQYLYLKKRDPNEPHTPWMRYMHGMNRISLIIFLLAITFMIIKTIIVPLFR